MKRSLLATMALVVFAGILTTALLAVAGDDDIFLFSHSQYA